jgi:hypothetical protein
MITPEPKYHTGQTLKLIRAVCVDEDNETYEPETIVAKIESVENPGWDKSYNDWLYHCVDAEGNRYMEVERVARAA